MCHESVFVSEQNEFWDVWGRKIVEVRRNSYLRVVKGGVQHKLCASIWMWVAKTTSNLALTARFTTLRTFVIAIYDFDDNSLDNDSQ